MLSFYRKYAKTIFDISLLVVTVYLFMLLFSFIYNIAAPIILALVIYACIEPLARFLNRHKVKKSIATAISMLVFILVILGLLTGAGIIFVIQMSNLAELIPHYASMFQEETAELVNYLMEQWEALPPDWAARIQEFAITLSGYLSTAATWLLNWLIGTITSVSSFVYNFVIAIVLAYFLSLESEMWKRLAREKTPSTFKEAFRFLRDNVLKGIFSYLKSQLKLVSITFVIVFASLLILGIKNAFSISLLCAVFDILPLLGVATLFVPWIIYLLIVGQMNTAIALAVVLAIVVTVRQILEPKITGDSLGVSAFTMLSFMVVSISLFGIAGLILSPILIVTLKALYEQGYLKRWIRLPKDEFDDESRNMDADLMDKAAD